MSLHPIDPDTVRRRLAAELPRWTLKDGALTRRFGTASFKGALMLATTVGHLAEVAWHHPDVHLTFGGVTIRLSTHEAGGITERDFALARKIEEVVGWRPGSEGGVLPGTPDEAAHAYVIDEP